MRPLDYKTSEKDVLHHVVLLRNKDKYIRDYCNMLDVDDWCRIRLDGYFSE